jgi:hypothetical protein
MGIDYDTKLIFGWMIKREKLLDLLDNEDQDQSENQEEGEDQSRDPMEYLDEIKEKLPKGCFLTYSSDYYDCPKEEISYYINLVNDDECSWYSLDELNQVIKNIDIEEIREFAVKLGADDKEAMIFAVLNVW